MNQYSLYLFFLGGTVEIECTVKNGNEYPILWMKLENEKTQNPVPISTGNKLFFKNSRFELDFDPNAGSYKLIISNVAKSDEGKYQCQVVTTPENVITADVDLKVKTAPVIKENSDSTVMQEVRIQMSILVICVYVICVFKGKRTAHRPS